MSTVKDKRVCVVFPVFSNYTVRVVFTADLLKAVKKYQLPSEAASDPDVAAMTVHMRDVGSFILLQHNASAGTIAHESWHAVKRMLDYLGVGYDSETVAYTLGYLVNQIVKTQEGK